MKRGGDTHSKWQKEQVASAVVTMTSVDIQYIRVLPYLQFGQLLVMDDSNYKSSFIPPQHYLEWYNGKAIKIGGRQF